MRIRLLSLFITGLLSVSGAAAEPQAALPKGQGRILFTGDILLSRQVEVEIARTGKSPWESLTPLLRRADLVLGNLEGAVGDPSRCSSETPANLCFAIHPSRLSLLARAGFHALSTENNHSGDLGSEGRQETASALRMEGMRPVNFDGGPSFFRVGGITVAVIAVNLVPSRTGSTQDVPSVPLRQQLRLASRLAQAVIVSVHWGDELLDWPSARQREAASWLAANGASVVVGHHPHVVQPPECVSGKPVFFSVGNHLFDQKYPATKEGLIADCAIDGAGLVCTAIATRTQMRSFFPEVASGSDTTSTALQGCAVPLNKPMRAEDTLLHPSPASDGSSLNLEGIRDGHAAFRSRPVRTLSAELTYLAGRDHPPLLLALERHPSPLDGEDGIRPYVYEVGPRGLIARWRGSGLAWPLVDATILPGSPDLLCALHRRDSFLALDPGAPADRAAVYQWNSFGFSGVQDAVALRACRKVWNLEEERVR